MSVLNRIKNKLESLHDRYLPLREFHATNQPWIDQPNADIDSFLRKFKPRFEVSYDLADKLTNWRKNGYAVLENIIPKEMIDKFMADVDRLTEEPEKHKLSVRIDLPEFLPNQQRNISEFPKEALKGKYVKFNDFHNSSVAGKQLMAHPGIVTFLEAVFNQQVVVMQSLTFLYGSQQPTHQDFPWVTAKDPSHLAAAWIALEDIKIDSGPLYYFLGSHRMPKFDFGSGILYKPWSTKTPLQYAEYLDKTCAEIGYPKEILLIKKGDVLIWHGALAHGGSPILTPSQTRKSYVCHYSTHQALPYHRISPGLEPVIQNYNGMYIYNNPAAPESEDTFR
jgi:phytanoyl-CoA hydroxylase